MVVDLNKTQPSEKNKNIRVTEILPQELYRGDSNKYNNYDIHNLLDGEYKFFGLTKEDVEEYGVIFKFTLKRPLYLVRLDDINTRNELYKIGDAKIKKILERNYGHNKGEFRDSEEGADYEMSSFICKNYDGYITDKMKSYHFGGNFHREIMICNPKNKFNEVEQITKPEQANKLRTEYSLKLHELKEAKTRKKKISRSYFDEDEDDEENIPATKMNAFSYASPMKTNNISDFSTPTKSPNMANRALSFATPGGSRCKSKTKKRKSKKHGGKTKKHRTKQKGSGVGNSKPAKSSPPPTKTRKNVNFSPTAKPPSTPKQNKTKKMFISRNKSRQKAVTQYENKQQQIDLMDMALGRKPLGGGKKNRKKK
jgi:hypothetical protein